MPVLGQARPGDTICLKEALGSCGEESCIHTARRAIENHHESEGTQRGRASMKDSLFPGDLMEEALLNQVAMPG